MEGQKSMQHAIGKIAAGSSGEGQGSTAGELSGVSIGVSDRVGCACTPRPARSHPPPP